MIALGSIDSAVSGAAGLPFAFLVGMVSFFSPCVLPLVPGYLSYMSGVSGQDLEAGSKRGRVILASLLFVLGFAIIFTGLGASASWLGDLLFDNISTLERFAGVVVIVMGLIFLTTLAIKPLMRGKQSSSAFVRGSSAAGLKVASIFSTERGMHPRTTAGIAGALPLGAAFAVSWTPCVGPGLAAILGLAANEGSATKGAALLFSFSLGFGAWFVLAAIGFRRAMGAFAVVRRHMRGFILFGGLTMVTIGVLMVTNRWSAVMAPLRRLINRFVPPI